MTEPMNRLCRALAKLPEACRRAGEIAAGEAAQAAQAQAAALAPVDTGALAASLHCAEVPGGAEVRTDCAYAAAVELGSRRQPPRPYLLPAAQAQAAAYPQRAAELARAAMGGGTHA